MLSILFILFYLAVISLLIVIYVFTGLSLYKAAKLEGYNKKWLAWIPIINTYLLFKLGDINPNYIWLIIINFPLAIVLNLIMEIDEEYAFKLTLVISLIVLIISIFTIIITIQSYLNIVNKYNVNTVWFILGLFISPFSLIVYIILFNT